MVTFLWSILLSPWKLITFSSPHPSLYSPTLLLNHSITRLWKDYTEKNINSLDNIKLKNVYASNYNTFTYYDTSLANKFSEFYSTYSVVDNITIKNIRIVNNNTDDDDNNDKPPSINNNYSYFYYSGHIKQSCFSNTLFDFMNLSDLFKTDILPKVEPNVWIGSDRY